MDEKEKEKMWVEKGLSDMTYEDWIEKYHPIMDGSSPQWIDDYKEIDKYVKTQNNLCVWTEVDVDGYTYIYSGWHYVNRSGYYVCEVPIKEGENFMILREQPECYECETFIGDMEESLYDVDGNQYCQECWDKLPEDRKEKVDEDE